MLTFEDFGVYTFHWLVQNPACEASDDVIIRYNLAEPLIDLVGGEFILLNEDPIMSYQWFLNGESIPGATSPNYIPLSNEFGSFSVLATSPSDCSSMSASMSWGPTGIEEYDKDLVRVYPNPVQGNGTCNIELNGLSEAYIKILNSQGSIVIERAITRPTNQVDGYQLSKGFYILQVMDIQGNPVSSKKLTFL
jgi:hypothetical protein